MRIVKIGDHARVVCEKCKAVTRATFSLSDVVLSNGGSVKSVTVAKCDECNTVCSVPRQSTPKINKALASKKPSIGVKLPAHHLDILNLVAFEVAGRIDFVPCLLRFYLHSLSSGHFSSLGLADYKNSELYEGILDSRLAVTGVGVKEDIISIQDMTGVYNTTKLVKLVVMRIYDDILLKKDKAILDELGRLVIATG